MQRKRETQQRAETLRLAAEHAARFLDGLPGRRVGPLAEPPSVRAALDRPLPESGVDPETVIEELARDADAGLVATAGPRFFGFVVGGSLPAALAADWLVSAWDQNAGHFALSPSASIMEDVAAGWVLDLLGLPRTASVGFVTGAQAANVTGLAAARHEVLRRSGWDVERDGLNGAPRVDVLVGEEGHATVFAALGLLGLGAKAARPVRADEQGRMDPRDLARKLREREGPTIVCAQAGNVNTGACDPFGPIAAACAEHEAWLHVDGAFGLWAAANPRTRELVQGVELADSWAVDAHKWLINVPYDSGLAIVAHPAAHRAAMALTASYLAANAAQRDPTNLVPESSRRAHGAPVYAALRSLGRRGVAELVERCCAHARRMAELLAAEPGVRVLNDVVLNQVLVRVGDDDEVTRAAAASVQEDGTCWVGETAWKGSAAMRVSVSNWSTSEDDIRRAAAAIAAAARRAGANSS